MTIPEIRATVLDHPVLLVTCPRGWEAEARQELRRALPDAHVESLYIGGNIMVLLAGPLQEALEALRAARTIVVAHVTPVAFRLQIGRGREWLDGMREAAKLYLSPPDPERSFMVAVDRRGEHSFTSQEAALAIADAFVDGGRPRVDLNSPEQVLSVEIYQDVVFMGMNEAADLLRKELRRMRRWAPGERPVNRAALKLREAIEEFGLELPREGRALDLGAAPGGWTAELAGQMAEVVAVDNADLDERVAALPNVTHLRLRTQDLDPEEMGQFDLLVNDMNMEPVQSAELLCELAPLLRPGGLAVMTIKFVTRHRRRHMVDASAALERCYEDVRIAAMPHNAKETTAVMRRKAELPGREGSAACL